MYCIDCGQAQPVKDARFCPFCGEALLRPLVDEGMPGPEGIQPPASPITSGAGGEPTASTGQSGAPSAAQTTSSDAAQDPLNYPLAVTLDRARWVPLKGQSDALRSRLRWAVAAALVLAVVLAAAAAWWWAHQEDGDAEDGIEVERIEAVPGPAGPAENKPAEEKPAEAKSADAKKPEPKPAKAAKP
ncbi:MAG: hypothetical protein RI972_1369 [Pseudomonadota bacterium]